MSEFDMFVSIHIFMYDILVVLTLVLQATQFGT